MAFACGPPRVVLAYADADVCWRMLAYAWRMLMRADVCDVCVGGCPQVMAIYFDDMQAGYTVVGNKFIDVQVC
jgi:hypothetical protein